MAHLELTSSSEAHVVQVRKRFRGNAELHLGLEPTETQVNATRTTAVQLLLWHQLPAWQQEGNHYIESGYRPTAESIWHCLHSLTYLHNETVNIVSHAIGAVIFFVLPFYIFNTEIPPRYAVATFTDKVVCSAYFLGVAVCFVFSVGFHIFFNHSPRLFSMGQKLDFQGVVLLMWGANVPLIYYSFICDPELQIRYWLLITFLAICCSVTTFQPRFSNPHLRHWRAAIFGSLALSTFIPVFHGLFKYGYEVHQNRIALPWILLTLLFNSLGAAAYASKFPERLYPRRFDLFGASHQIMHVAILVAAATYGVAVTSEFDYLHSGASICNG
ncbi:hemolysin-III channel protein-like protein Izh2 [Cercophora newfieldiana]|uniref:Hemolysin-III channel protein-like protein Izh2 n=1 Tax=Cercophora newfieldiana TaxID=92897 RepID=A0AA39Y9L6_9PEZI|nr:hemolysin-III channel protein-like protein Izh2 [Cercophora newfieldiana]